MNPALHSDRSEFGVLRMLVAFFFRRAAKHRKFGGGLNDLLMAIAIQRSKS